MRSFLLFAGYNYYPSGGFDDFVSDHHSLEEAKVAGEFTLDHGTGCDWAHIVDISHPGGAKVFWSQAAKAWSR